MNKTLYEQTTWQHPQRSPRWMALVFAIGILVLGMLGSCGVEVWDC